MVIDCSSYIANDILSAVALMEADSVLRLANCDLKSIGYLSSQLPLLRELHWDDHKQYKAASNIKPLQAADRIGQVLGSVAFKLPYSQEVEEQYLEGNLLTDLAMKDGKARLIRDDYCDGLGNCLPACPAGAISFEMREAAPYDEEAVKEHLARRGQGGCEGSRAAEIEPAPAAVSPAAPIQSELRQWPIQIKLAPVNAPFFSEADILIAADCTAYACGDFHSRFMRG